MLELWGMLSILFCHRSLGQSGPKWWHLIGSYQWNYQVELNDVFMLN